MSEHRFHAVGLGLGFALALTACPADEEPADDTGAMTSAATDEPTTSEPTTGGPMACLGIGGPGAAGSACTSNDDCMSGVCKLFQDVPTDPAAVCGDEPAMCATNITATLYDFSQVIDNGAASPLGGTQVRVVKALEAITDPVNAMAIAEATPGDDGRIDVISNGAISAPIAIIAVAGGGDYFLTATAVAGEVEMGQYTVGTGIHEFWAVRNDTVTAWSAALMEDPDAVGPLKDGLGISGGVIGFVRDGQGVPVEGATVTSDSDSSGALIRFPQDDGTMGTEMTGPSGSFVVLEPTPTGEDFTAEFNGMTGSGTAGTANNVIFTLIMDL